MILFLSAICIFSGSVIAGETGHYTNGVEGIKAASLPPKGFYYKMYNTFYTADKIYADDTQLPMDFDLFVFANVHRFIYNTGIKILGADYIVDAIVPLVYTDIELEGQFKDDKFSVGDLNVEPGVLAWHGARWDAAAGFGIFIPVGDYDKTEPASPGKDMWTFMFTAGGTYYFDEAKTWTVSALARYQIHTEKKDLEVRPGDDFSFEWGAGKTIARIFDVGVAGYCSWQVTEDSKGDVTLGGKKVKDSTYAVGPEVSAFIPPLMLQVSLKSEWEFGVNDRTQGNVTTLALTKIF